MVDPRLYYSINTTPKWYLTWKWIWGYFQGHPHSPYGRTSEKKYTLNWMVLFLALSAFSFWDWFLMHKWFSGSAVLSQWFSFKWDNIDGSVQEHPKCCFSDNGGEAKNWILILYIWQVEPHNSVILTGGFLARLILHLISLHQPNIQN